MPGPTSAPPLASASANTICDGIAVKRPGDYTLPLVERYVIETEEAALASFRVNGEALSVVTYREPNNSSYP